MDKRLVHAGDPETSRIALDRLGVSGHRATHAELVYGAVVKRPGLTSCEIMAPTGLGQYQVRRRLTDLKNDHHIEAKFPRKCGSCGSYESTWYEGRGPEPRQLELPK